MAKTVTSSINVQLNSILANTLGVAAGQATIQRGLLKALASGVGADQCDVVYSETKTIAASGTYDVDLTGALTDAFGAAANFARVKLVAVFADAGNTNNVVVGGAAATQWQGPFGAVAHTVHCAPGGLVVLMRSDATAWPVVGGASDLLRFTNGAAGTSVLFDFIILGCSA